MRQYRIPYVFVEDDYWTAKYLWLMSIGWGIVSNDRLIDGTGVFKVEGTAVQFAFLEAQPDVVRIDTPTPAGTTTARITTDVRLY